MGQSPFLGVIRTQSGDLIDMLSGTVVTQADIVPRMAPFYGRFYDVNGDEHDLLELIGVGGVGDVSLAQVNALIQAHNLNLTSHANVIFTHQQNVAAAVWTVNHNLNRQYVEVQIIDSAGNDCETDVEYVSANQVRVIFPVAVAGTAVVRR